MSYKNQKNIFEKLIYDQITKFYYELNILILSRSFFFFFLLNNQILLLITLLLFVYLYLIYCVYIMKLMTFI